MLIANLWARIVRRYGVNWRINVTANFFVIERING